ncbi:MAG: type III pantothenate kinase [Phycisphaerales bacterium]
MHLLAVSVGNTRTRFGLFRDRSLDQSVVVENSDPEAVAAAIRAVPTDRPDAPVVLASVNDPFADRVAALLARDVAGRLHRFGRGFEVPIKNALTDDSTVGQDRLLNALGAYARGQDACVIVDAGTAVTVDFVDGTGVFQGGAIAPGLNMMLRALHERTAALPLLRYQDRPVPPAPPPGPGAEEPSPADPFGRDTPSAMIRGVRAAVVGMTRLLADEYAQFFGAYPRIIATGGDAGALFENDPIVEHIIPDLTLLGIHAACVRLLGDGDEGDED